MASKANLRDRRNAGDRDRSRFVATGGERVTRLVLCDVGPGLPVAFREGLAKRLAAPPTFGGMVAFREHVARLLARNGLSGREALIDRLTAAWMRRLDDGRVGYHYDPVLSEQFRSCPEDFDLWPLWDRLTCPVLVLRGDHSDVLSKDDLAAMLRRQPRAVSETLPGSGHLNFLDDPDHQDRVVAFLHPPGA